MIGIGHIPIGKICKANSLNSSQIKAKRGKKSENGELSWCSYFCHAMNSIFMSDEVPFLHEFISIKHTLKDRHWSIWFFFRRWSSEIETERGKERERWWFMTNVNQSVLYVLNFHHTKLLLLHNSYYGIFCTISAAICAQNTTTKISLMASCWCRQKSDYSVRNLNRVEGKLLDLRLSHCSQREADDRCQHKSRKKKKRNIKQDSNIARIGIVLLSICVFFLRFADSFPWDVKV